MYCVSISLSLYLSLSLYIYIYMECQEDRDNLDWQHIYDTTIRFIQYIIIPLSHI